MFMSSLVIHCGRAVALIHDRFFKFEVNISITYKKIQGTLYSFNTLSLTDCFIKLVISAYPFLMLGIDFRYAGRHCFGIPGDCCHL